MRTQQPAVSVIMPVLNEERYLRDSVRHILGQQYDGEMEVVIALGPSTDRTDEIAAELVREDPRVHTVPNPTGRTPAALNAAIGASRHPIVVRVDGHGMLSPNYIATAVRLLAETGAQNVGGIMHAEGENAWEDAVAAAMTSKIGVGNAAFHTGGQAGPAETVYLGVFRREALEQQGGYNIEFIRAQDWELNFRIREAGGLIWFSPELKVQYRPRPSVRALAKQYKDYGRWRHVVARYHAGSINLRYLAPPVAVCAIAAGLVAGAVLSPWAFVIPGGYLAAITAGSVPAGKGLSLKARLQIPVALATMHMSWGWGFLTSPRSLARKVIASRRPTVHTPPPAAAEPYGQQPRQQSYEAQHQYAPQQDPYAQEQQAYAPGQYQAQQPYPPQQHAYAPQQYGQTGQTEQYGRPEQYGQQEQYGQPEQYGQYGQHQPYPEQAQQHQQPQQPYPHQPYPQQQDPYAGQQQPPQDRPAGW